MGNVTDKIILGLTSNELDLLSDESFFLLHLWSFIDHLKAIITAYWLQPLSCSESEVHTGKGNFSITFTGIYKTPL